MTFYKGCLIPATGTGSATTYYADGLWVRDDDMISYVGVGGITDTVSCMGAFTLYADFVLSHKSWNVNTSISCKPLAPIEEVE
jgi:hypothetical protein